MVKNLEFGKPKIKFVLKFICTLFLIPSVAFADTTKIKKVTFGGIINPSNSPETGFLVAANGLCFFKTDSKDTILLCLGTDPYLCFSLNTEPIFGGDLELFLLLDLDKPPLIQLIMISKQSNQTLALVYGF